MEPNIFQGPRLAHRYNTFVLEDEGAPNMSKRYKETKEMIKTHKTLIQSVQLALEFEASKPAFDVTNEF